MPNLRSMHGGRWNCRRKPELLERSGVRRPSREWGLGPAWGTLPVKSGEQLRGALECARSMFHDFNRRERERRENSRLSLVYVLCSSYVSGGGREWSRSSINAAPRSSEARGAFKDMRVMAPFVVRRRHAAAR